MELALPRANCAVGPRLTPAARGGTPPSCYRYTHAWRVLTPATLRSGQRSDRGTRRSAATQRKAQHAAHAPWSPSMACRLAASAAAAAEVPRADPSMSITAMEARRDLMPEVAKAFRRDTERAKLMLQSRRVGRQVGGGRWVAAHSRRSGAVKAGALATGALPCPPRPQGGLSTTPARPLPPPSLPQLAWLSYARVLHIPLCHRLPKAATIPTSRNVRSGSPAAAGHTAADACRASATATTSRAKHGAGVAAGAHARQGRRRNRVP